MGAYQHIKRYKHQYGLDLKSTDLNRRPEFATGMLNAQYKKTGGTEKRPGYQAVATGGAGLGLFEYNKKNPTTGADEAEVISIGQSAKRLRFTTLAVSYSGVATTVRLSHYFDVTDSEYKFTLTAVAAGASPLISVAEDLGVGYDEASSMSVTALAAIINAADARLTATVTGDGSVPAAFLGITREHDLYLGSKTLECAYWEDINDTVTNPFSTFYAARNDSDFEIMSGFVGSNVLYLSGGGYDYVHKYDGQTLYRAGLPDVASLATALGSATGITGTNYLYAARYIQYDAAGNIIEGNLLFTENELDATDDKINVTVANVLAGTGFNTNGAVVNGAQTTQTTLTVDSGHTMQVDDTAYFYDAVSADYVERTVTAIAATTITISGAAVTVADNAVISNNLRIGLFRSKTSAVTPTEWYYLAEIPNDSFNATQVYVDAVADASLGPILIEPLTDRTAPLKMRYISMFQNQMVGCGVKNFPNTFFWSDVDGLEYFPSDQNSQPLDTLAGDVLTGVAPNNEICAIFKGKSTCVLSGQLSSNNIRFDWLVGSIGCVAHATIKDVEGQLCWMSDRGPYGMFSGQIPRPLGENEDGGGRIEPVADQSAATSATRLQFKRAVGFLDRDDQKYVIFMPAESTTGSNVHSNSNSLLYVWDYARGVDKGAWLKWSNMDMSGGAIAFDGERYFQERRYSSYNDAIAYNLYRRHTLKDAWAYQDNTEAIDWEYDGPWETLGHAGIYKKFLELRGYFTPEEETPFNSASAATGATIDVETEANFIANTPYADFSVVVEEPGYGVTPYGTAPYGDPSIGFFSKKLSIGKFCSMRVRWANNVAQQNVDLTAWEIEAVASFKPELKE